MGVVNPTHHKACFLLAMEDVKQYLVGWLDWAARYAATDPYDFIGRCEKRVES